MATFPLATKVAQDYLQSKRSFNGQSVVYAVPSFLRGLVAENGALLASEEQVAAAIQRNDPQGFAQVVQSIPETMQGAQINGGQIEYTEAPDEGFGEDWLAPVMMVAGYGITGAMNGAFSGLPGADGLAVGGVDASWGVNPQGGPYIGDELIPPTMSEVNNFYASPEYSALLKAGVDRAAAEKVAGAMSKGFGLKEAMSLAGIAAPVLGALMGSSAIKDASGAQQEATNAAIGRIEGSTAPALESITAAQVAGAGEQNRALDEGIRFGRETYDSGVAEQRRSLDIARGDLAPWREAGSVAITNIGELVNDPNSSLMRKFTVADFMDDPVTKLSYQSGLDAGTKALSSSARSRGTLNSGGTLKALTKFGTDYTGNQAGASRDRFVGDQNNTYSRLMGVSDTGQRAVSEGNQFGMGVANNIANAGNLMSTNAAQLRAGTANNIANSGNVAATNKANIQIGSANSIANLMGAQGNARGAAAIAQGNTMGNAANSIGNWWSSQETLDKILAARK